MSSSPEINKQTLHRLLFNATNLEVIKEIVAEKATYVSLSFDNPELQTIIPWCGTHESGGPEAIYNTVSSVHRYWRVEKFDIQTTLADNNEVAVFGHFVGVSNKLNKVADTPFAVLARFNEHGMLEYMQFMEETFSTAKSLKSGL